MKRVFVLAVLLISAVIAAYSSGSLSATGELLFENLSAGKIYHVKDIGKDLFRITNNTDQDIELRIDPIIPDKALLRKGYERLPDLRWVKTDVNTMRLSPGQVGSVDVTISIPAGKKYMGKKYQFHVWSRIIPSSNIGIKVSAGTESIFRITTAK